jgi:hypothetical protein
MKMLDAMPKSQLATLLELGSGGLEPKPGTISRETELANQGNPMAMAAVAGLYAYGSEVTKDCAKAQDWLQKALEAQPAWLNDSELREERNAYVVVTAHLASRQCPGLLSWTNRVPTAHSDVEGLQRMDKVLNNPQIP